MRFAAVFLAALLVACNDNTPSYSEPMEDVARPTANDAKEDGLRSEMNTHGTENCVDLDRLIDRNRERVLSIPGVVDVAHGEDENGTHVLVFAESEKSVPELEEILAKSQMFKGCRIVVRAQLRIG